MTDTGPITTLVVDDELDMRALVRVVIELAGLGLEVVGEAADGEEALEKFCSLNPPPTPTVVLLDNRMPKMSGLEVAERILRKNPDQVVVLFSAHLDDEVRVRAAALGIAACLSKEHLDAVPRVIRELGEAALSA